MPLSTLDSLQLLDYTTAKIGVSGVVHSQLFSVETVMTRKFVQVTLALMLGSLPLVLWADSNLDYQNRGDRFEGVRPKPVSGYDIEVISVLADYQEPANQLPDELRVGFYLQSQTPVHLTVREQDDRL